jgi:hypothetical protein
MPLAQSIPLKQERRSYTDSKANIIDIDNLICREVERLTNENNAIWTSPDHNRREYVHSFFQYPAMMVPVVQKKIIEILKRANPSISNVIDPFMGSATSLVACMESGLNIYGQDINPLAVLIAKTRTGPYYVDSIKKEKKEFLYSNIDADKSTTVEVNFNGVNKWFRKDVSIELSKIVRAIRIEERKAIRRFFWVILAETIRLTSNDRTSTFKLHSRPPEEIEKRFISPIDTFKDQLEGCIEDLEVYQKMLLKANRLSKGSYVGEREIILQDSSISIFSPQSAPFYDLLVTSPPYGDNKTTVTYGQHSYLPLQWIDFLDIDDKADCEVLRTTLEIDNRSLGGGSRELNDEQIHFLSQKSKTFNETYLKLKNYSPELVRKVLVFIYDLSNVVENVFKVMKDDSYQVWTIANRTVGGLEIPNTLILRELIEEKSGILITQIEREIINKRMAKRNNSSSLMNTEDILIFRKIGSK